MNWSARRINAAARINNARTYLEIGVYKGETFFDVEIEYKDAVDPHFLFETSPLASEKVRFFSQTSDAFWTSDKPLKYDLIMIDGLHTFEQTFRDLVCSMRFAHDRTVWLIDDTLPTDVFSAIPDQAKAFRERQKMQIGGSPWHGDVYKIIPAIHDFVPVLEYVTIINSGNPQTLAWYQTRSNFQARQNNLETISRMTFFDIESHISIFRLVEEVEAMNQLKTAFS